MSAAHLHRLNPNWSGESLVYLTNAISLLRLQLNDVLDEVSTGMEREQSLDQALIGIILIGISTSWHKSSGLGLEHIVGSRILLQGYVCPKLYDGSALDRRKLSFFIGLQAYWETVASFLLDQNLEQLDYLYDACVELSVDTIYVHPWTGISSTIWALLAKAGCVARKRLLLLAKSPCSDQVGSSAEMNLLIQQATVIEAQLFSYELPPASHIDGTLGDHTSMADLKRIAQCCRMAAFLELYRGFGFACDTQSTLDMLSAQLPMVEWESESTKLQDSSLNTDICSFLTFGILKTLRQISPESSTRCLQPMLLLIAGSSLLYEGIKVPPCAATLGYETADSLSTESDTIRAWREFVYKRIACVEQRVKLDSLRRMRETLTEVWTCADTVQVDTPSNCEAQHIHWINIMEENGLRFIY
jgi:hypothetical protein